MKQVPIQEFQKHASKYLKDLPIVLTRYNVPVMVVKDIGKEYSGVVWEGKYKGFLNRIKQEGGSYE